ncbi:MAG: lysophospholipid acyltransferase family protein [Deltaproteobacteria bacterium]|nr:lysophospholipid acyltransferase family protein [Deltaproteobacteria bacterium]
MSEKPLTLRRRILARLADLAPWLLRPLLFLLRRSLRVEYVGDADLRARWARNERAVLACWHNRLLILPVLGEEAPMCIMVSQHRDGEMATQLLGAWGVTTVRGSATRGAVGGFLRLVDAFRHGNNMMVFPDGPRGPRYVAKPGVIHLAKAVAAPIYPVAYATTRAWRLKSWDRLIVPKPFGRIRVAVGAPLSVPQDASSEQLTGLVTELQARLVQLSESVEAEMGMVDAPARARG